MRYLIPLYTILLFASLCGSVLADDVRLWTDSTGKFKTEAEFVSYGDGVVTLRKPGTDKTVKIPLERLSDPDQEYVDDLLREMEQQEDGEQKPKPPSVNDATAATPESSRAPHRPPNNVINSVRGAVYRVQTINILRQIGLAIQQYATNGGKYPPAALQTRDGQAGLSWRVAILPMLGESGLYRQFKRDEPWDSDHNKALISRMPAIFQSPGSDLDSGYTNYLAVTAPDTVLATGKRASRLQDIRDGTSRTIMIVEADDTYASIWTKPDEYDWDPNQPGYGLGGIWNGVFFAIFADGVVKDLNVSIGATQLNAYFSRNAGD